MSYDLLMLAIDKDYKYLGKDPKKWLEKLNDLINLGNETHFNPIDYDVKCPGHFPNAIKCKPGKGYINIDPYSTKSVKEKMALQLSMDICNILNKKLPNSCAVDDSFIDDPHGNLDGVGKDGKIKQDSYLCDFCDISDIDGEIKFLCDVDVPADEDGDLTIGPNIFEYVTYIDGKVTVYTGDDIEYEGKEKETEIFDQDMIIDDEKQKSLLEQINKKQIKGVAVVLQKIDFR